MRKIDSHAQGTGQLLIFMFVLMLMFFVFGNAYIRAWLEVTLDVVLFPLIGFAGKFPLLTLFFAGIIMVFFSSLLTHIFTNWKAMAKAQETSKAFQKEIMKARREGNTNRVNKLMKMQPEIMKMSMQSSSGMMKPMFFLLIFIAPIFIWLTYFLVHVQYYYFTVPWANGASLIGRDLFITNWFLLYLVFSFLVGQLIRQGLKWISWSNRWQSIRKTIRPSA